ncbi:MAG: class I SAM-dependent methyltransferase, partial [Candidatus Omnitrophica bacterium]|nr:class I SAM-dependent methyltransferase [Candidatus Omnitrophota bacterium]
GSGRLFKYLPRAGKKYFACDVNLKMLLFAKLKKGLNISYFCSSGGKLPCKSKSIDLVTLIGVLQNCGEDLKCFINDVSRIIKKGGRIFIVTKNLGWDRFIYGKLKPEYDHNWFFDYELESALNEAGFEVDKKGGFDNRSGEVTNINLSHEMFILARKTVN